MCDSILNTLEVINEKKQNSPRRLLSVLKDRLLWFEPDLMKQLYPRTDGNISN